MKFTNTSDSRILAVHGIFADPTRMLMLKASESKAFPNTRLSVLYKELASAIPYLSVEEDENAKMTDEEFKAATSSITESLDKPGTVFIKVATNREPTEDEKKALPFLFDKKDKTEDGKKPDDHGKKPGEKEEEGGKKPGEEPGNPNPPKQTDPGKPGEGKQEGGKETQPPAPKPTISFKQDLSASLELTAGDNLSLSVKAESSDNKSQLTYQWKKDGTDLTGTASNYSKSSVVEADAGTYTVVVKGSKGEDEVTSVSCTVTVKAKVVTPPAAPPAGTEAGTEEHSAEEHTAEEHESP